MSHLSSSSTVFKFNLFWTPFMLHFFVRCTLSCCTFFRVGFFSCRIFFLLHISYCSTLFMLQFFHVTLFPVWTFTFDLFLVWLFSRCPFFFAVFFSHCTLSFYTTFFHVALISCCTYSLYNIFNVVLFHNTLSQRVEIVVTLSLHLIMQLFQWVFKAVNLSRTFSGL